MKRCYNDNDSDYDASNEEEEEEYLIWYENNGSKRWDRREIFVNTSWLEEIYSADELCYGAKVCLPWHGKGEKLNIGTQLQQLQWKLRAQVLASITLNNSCCWFVSCIVLK